MTIIDDIISWIIAVFVGICLVIIIPEMANNWIKYYPEALQFVEDFYDMRELGQEIYYFNFDPISMIYITDESYDYIREMWKFE